MGPTETFGFLRVSNVFLERWRALFGIPLLAALGTVAITYAVHPVFTATTVVLPEVRSAGRLPASLAGLAGQLGLSVGSEGSQSPRFYVQLAESRAILERVLLDRYADPRPGAGAADSTTLLQLLRVKGRSAADSLSRGVKKLRGLITVVADNQTNAVTLTVDSWYPEVAAAAANRVVQYLNEFNTGTRQSQARERRKFVETRLSEGEQELAGAEERLKTFHDVNRSWQQAPQLTFEEGRLRRQVEIRQELYLTLRREYETARIEEVNDTPVITVIDRAVPPQQKSKPRRLLLGVVALVFGGMFAVLWVFWSDYLDRVRREESELYGRFNALLGSMVRGRLHG